MKIPLLSGAANTFKAVFMDTPGFMEAMRERATQVAHASLKSSCAYLFVMTYEHMQDNGDAEILKQLQSFDKCKYSLYMFFRIIIYYIVLNFGGSKFLPMPVLSRFHWNNLANLLLNHARAAYILVL